MLTESNEDQAEIDRKEKIWAEFKEKLTRYRDYWEPIYKKVEDRYAFTVLGKQFGAGEAKQYGLKKPMEPNLLLTYANHEANKTLQTDYRGKVSPNGGNATIITARERQDVLRGLQRTNKIKEVFNQARRLQVCGGIAYAMTKIDYASKRGYGKTIITEFIKDYKNVFPDITADSCTFADANDFIIKQEVPKAQWKKLTGQSTSDWGNKKTKDLYNYWVREDVEDAEYVMEDGPTMMGSALKGEDDEPDMTGVKLGPDGQPLSRPTSDPKWRWYKITDEDGVIDEEEYLGAYPPLTGCVGRKVMDRADEKNSITYQPLTQFAEEPQKIYTIIENIIALRLGKSPFSKWKVAFESINIKDMVELRKNAMVGDMDILYRGLTDDGKPIPPPEEIEPHVLDAILITLQQEQDRKIQKIFGIFDANLGNKSNEQSGIAIRERAQGGELSNYDLQFQYMEFVEQVTRVQLDLIPKYLTAPQQIAFVDEDDNAVLQWINTTGGKQFSPDEEYSLSVEAMPVSPTAREDEAEALMNMAKVLPIMQQNAKVTAIIAKAQPGRYSQQISEILAGGDPQLQEAQKAIQELQGKLQQTEQQAQAKQAQDAQAIAGLKGAVGTMRSQMQLMKQSHAIQGQTAQMQKAHEDITKQMDEMDKALDRQVAQYSAESGRITAEAGMLKVVGELAKPPEPATPAPGQGLP